MIKLPAASLPICYIRKPTRVIQHKSMLRLLRTAATSKPRSTETWLMERLTRSSTFGAIRDYGANTPAAMGISDSIKHDHVELKSFADLILKSTDPDEQTRYQNQFTWELARHAVGEELVVYPALEKYLKDGEELANKDRREHQSVSSCN